MSCPLTLLESSDVLGRYRYVELALFETLGERAPHAEAPAIVVALAAASRAHAFRAGLFEAHLPVSVGLAHAAACTRSPGPAFGEVLGALPAGEAGEQLLAVLSGELYPEMRLAYVSHLARCSFAADPPVARVLQRCIDDLDHSLNALAAARRDGGALDDASSHGLRAAIALGGGVFGPLV